MKIASNDWTLQDHNFGPLLPYIQDQNVTDIEFNGKDVWIEDLVRGPYKADLVLTPEFVDQFSVRISNVVSSNFNKNDNVLEAETETLRVSIIHESATATGCSIVIRKTPAIRRMTKESMLEDAYCSEEVLNLLINCIKGHMNMVVCGLPGSGKTELVKFLTQFIPPEEKAMTIEDNLEIHYRSVNPGSNCVELKVDEKLFSYTKAIKTCLRQNPKWMILSEARSLEVKYLLEGFSTGISGLTTLHTDDTRKIPDRIQNMMHDSLAADRLENDIYTFVNMGVLVRKRTSEDGKIFRYIDQICFFDRVGGENKKMLIADGGMIIDTALSENILKKFALYDVFDPFSQPE